MDAVFERHHAVVEAGEAQALGDERRRRCRNEQRHLLHRGDLLDELQPRKHLDEPVVEVVVPGETEKDALREFDAPDEHHRQEGGEVLRIVHRFSTEQAFTEDAVPPPVHPRRHRDVDVVRGYHPRGQGPRRAPLGVHRAIGVRRRVALVDVDRFDRRDRDVAAQAREPDGAGVDGRAVDEERSGSHAGALCEHGQAFGDRADELDEDLPDATTKRHDAPGKWGWAGTPRTSPAIDGEYDAACFRPRGLRQFDPDGLRMRPRRRGHAGSAHRARRLGPIPQAGSADVDTADLHTITMARSSCRISYLSYLPRTVLNLALPQGGASGRRRDR